MSQIKDLIFTSGERYPILLKADGVPDFWVTLYVTEKLRPSHTQTSITNAISHLRHLAFWEKINNRDLFEEFNQLRFLTNEDIYSIRDHCMLDTRSLKKWLQPSNKNVVKFASASTATSTLMQTVSINHASNRMFYIATFLDFTARAVLKNKLIDESITDSIDNMSKRLLANKPKGNRGRGLSGDPNAKAPSPEAFERILAITREDSPDNPFKSSEVRFRNALIFDVMDATGMRAGEIMALQIEDISYGNTNDQKPAISIVRRHDAVEDPRKKQPVAKTRERKIPVSKIITDRLRDYIMGMRANIKQARKHPYVFVTHKHGKYFGSPISNSTFINRIIKPAIAVSPELLEEINRHGFRHYFNYKLSKKIDAINKAAKTNPNITSINEKQELQIRKELNGWVSDTTAETYNLRHIREEADRVMREDIDHWSKFANKDK